MAIKSIFIIIIISIITSISELYALDPSFLRLSTSLQRSSFPQDFRFGAASSAYQSEGAANVDGREPSIWDTFTKQYPEKISDGSNGDVADEFYYRFKEDVAHMKEIGLDSFRFSISWSRILPRGTVAGGVNQAGINFYNHLINELISNGIRPLVTLFHWDTPQALEDEYGGFLNPQIVKDFVEYVDICFKEFGDRVKEWITINEPNMFAVLGYNVGNIAPGRCSSYVQNCTVGNSATEPYLVAHYLILSHAATVQLYRVKYQSFHGGTIGMTIQTYWMIPKYNTPACREAAKRALDFFFGWFADPITYGDYPKTMRELVGNRLPKFTKKQSKMVRGSFDFFGLNYYTSRYVEDVMFYANTNLSYTTDSRVNQTTEKNGVPVGEPTSADWLFICPEGFQDVLLYIKSKFQNPVILVTENGMPSENDKSLSVNIALNDEAKIKYHQLHLTALLEAVSQGADVRGYYIWSLMDDFEWEFGYKYRYGLVYVDFQDGLKRHLKSSALWYHHFLSNSSSYQMD
nr:putative beta-glucosidase [Arabidopsis thaliana]